MRKLVCVWLLFLGSFTLYAQSNRTTIVIDAGHGGKDGGCQGMKNKESEITLKMSLKLGKLLQEHKKVKVVYTRKTNVFVKLSERSALANQVKADLFISVHCNASLNKKVQGTEIYVMGLHKSKDNLGVVKRENSVILLEEDYKKKYRVEQLDPNLSYIISSNYQNQYLNSSLKLASAINKHFGKLDRKCRKTKQAGFFVLWDVAMPSILIEIGYLTNRSEEIFLTSEKGQEALVKAIFEGIRSFL